MEAVECTRGWSTGTFKRSLCPAVDSSGSNALYMLNGNIYILVFGNIITSFSPILSRKTWRDILTLWRQVHHCIVQVEKILCQKYLKSSPFTYFSVFEQFYYCLITTFPIFIYYLNQSLTFHMYLTISFKLLFVSETYHWHWDESLNAAAQTYIYRM